MDNQKIVSDFLEEIKIRKAQIEENEKSAMTMMLAVASLMFNKDFEVQKLVKQMRATLRHLEEANTKARKVLHGKEMAIAGSGSCKIVQYKEDTLLGE